VLSSIVKFAEKNSALPEAPQEGPKRLTGDELTEAYLRVAAGAAAKINPANAAKGYAIGLAIAFDQSDLLRNNPLADVALLTIESDAERRHRLAVLGKPTAHGREDLLMHFSVSAALAVALNPQLSESAGVLKELKDAQGGSGFSFADLSADLAGIEFAKLLQQHPDRLAKLATGVHVVDYWPPLDALPEGLQASEFVNQFGTPSDARFLAMKAEIQKRIQALPGFADEGK
jgi:hypothetical protein